ncbi:hypothetical protein L7F22_037363 [Adiantum nelumboides]|nr:hypothetical protein [Adiantum nelumboides]
MKCYYCNKPGHLQADYCKKKADEEKGVGNFKRKSSNQAEVELELFVTIKENCNKAHALASHDSSWILDSSASRHITSHKEWFSSPKPLKESIQVAVGNDTKWSCYFESIASTVFDMDIEMNDSSPNLEKTKEDDGCGSSSLVKDAYGILSKSLSPSPNHFKSSPSTFLKRALRIARGRKLIKDELKVELDTQHFNAQLALSFASNKVPILLIFELFESISFHFAFEGKVLCKYGTYKITNNSYPKFLKADLLDKEGTHTITFVVADPYIPQLVESFQVEDFLHIEGICVKQRVKNDGGTSTLALHADATTLIVKGDSFKCRLTLYPEHKIADLFGSKLSFENPIIIGFVVVKVDNFMKSDGESAYRLVIADGPNSLDKAMVLLQQRNEGVVKLLNTLRNLPPTTFLEVNLLAAKGLQKQWKNVGWLDLQAKALEEAEASKNDRGEFPPKHQQILLLENVYLVIQGIEFLCDFVVNKLNGVDIFLGMKWFT